MIRGIYGVEASQISVGAAFPKWVVPAGATLISHLRALKGRSKPRQERPFMIAPRYGMQDLTSRLEGRLRERLGESLRKNAPIAPGILESLGDSNLVLAVPAREAGVLLGEQSPALGEMLLRCRYTSMVSVTVFAPVRGFSRKIRGVGVLIPAQEKERQCLGILFNSSSFGGRVQNEREWVSLTLMLGGLDHADWTLKSDFEIRAIVEAELGSILGYRHVSGAELQLSIHRWPRAIPVYDAHLEEVWGLARSSWCLEPGRVLFGNYTGQVSLRGMIESWAQWTETFKKSTVSAAREC
jgi:protoporphyrinogen oxidase